MNEININDNQKPKNEMQELINAGYQYIITYWVHSYDGGDDNCFVKFYKRKPTQKIINNLLRNSIIKTDYSIDKITDM